MQNLEIITMQTGCLSVKGDLTFASINAKTVKCVDFSNSCANNTLTLDLKLVTNCDSAGLALMIEWIKYSQQQQVKLIFQHIPQQLLLLAKLSGFEKNAYFQNAAG